LAYCGIVASGLYWRISQAEARLVERRKEHDENRKPKAEPPAAPPVERSSGRTEYAYRREDPYCGDEW
jgi:hypothetical protein